MSKFLVKASGHKRHTLYPWMVMPRSPHCRFVLTLKVRLAIKLYPKSVSEGGVSMTEVLSPCRPFSKDFQFNDGSLSIFNKRIGIQIEQPPLTFFEEQRLTLSYLNFYFVNGGIILPVFGGTAEETDRTAFGIASHQR